MSSDSGSTTNFREMEDGFAAYAASKAALNQMLRVSSPHRKEHLTPTLTPYQHMAAELKRKDDDTVIIAMHPGEVATYVNAFSASRFKMTANRGQRHVQHRSAVAGRRGNDS